MYPEQMLGILRFLLHYKPGSAFYLIGGLVLFVSMALFTQYKMKGRIDLDALIDHSAYMKPFWERNPRLKYVDSVLRTSLLMVKDTQTGLPALLDTTVVIDAEVRPTECSAKGALPSGMVPADATHLVCFQIIKPDTGAGTAYTGAVSFEWKGKDTQVAHFYRELFQARRSRVSAMMESSRGIILEAEDKQGNTLARIAT
jgi:hypothetical protein